VQLGGNLGAASAIASALQDLPLAFGERIKVGVPCFGGESGINHSQTAVDAADSVGQLRCGAVFQEIPACACVERAAQVAGARESGKDDCSYCGMIGSEVRRQLEPGHEGHFDVRNENVGGETNYCVEGIATVGSAGHDGDVGFEFKQCGKRAEDHGLVFGEDDTNG
jgi:hypothetical protein